MRKIIENIFYEIFQMGYQSKYEVEKPALIEQNQDILQELEQSFIANSCLNLGMIDGVEFRINRKSNINELRQTRFTLCKMNKDSFGNYTEQEIASFTDNQELIKFLFQYFIKFN